MLAGLSDNADQGGDFEINDPESTWLYSIHPAAGDLGDLMQDTAISL